MYTYEVNFRVNCERKWMHTVILECINEIKANLIRTPNTHHVQVLFALIKLKLIEKL